DARRVHRERERLLGLLLRAREGPGDGAVMMKTNLRMVVPIASALLLGCRAPAPASEDGAPKVEGLRVEIPPGSPQSQAVQLDAPRVGPAVSLHLNGRLAWDQTVTVGGYPAFSGRVTQGGADAGQRGDAGGGPARTARGR